MSAITTSLSPLQAAPFVLPGVPAACLPWSHPAFWKIACDAPRVWQQWQAYADLPRALNACLQTPVHFVPQAALPVGMAYESYVHAERCVPTRGNLHDAFHGLMWSRWPQAKQRMSAMQATEIARLGTVGARGPLRDALTLLDENGLVLLGSPELLQALQARQWQRVFVQERALWQDVTIYAIGHALLEKLYAAPHKSLTAHVYLPRQSQGPVPGQSVDAWLADELTPEHLAQKPFTPLPVLGIPGWWVENENFSFYDDSHVFRSARVQRVAQPA